MQRRGKKEGNFLCHIFGILLHTTTGWWCNYMKKKKNFFGKGSDESERRHKSRHAQTEGGIE